MKYLSEFRDGGTARHLADSISQEARRDRTYHFMEFCGGHTHAIARYGLQGLLPHTVQMIHGPGCPVCVLPIGRIDQTIHLALHHKVILCSFGDCLRVPGSDRLTLLKAKSRGADIRMIYSPRDALLLAQQHPDKQIVFLAIGFETTTPPTAAVIREADKLGLKNFSILCYHVLTPPAIRAILDTQDSILLDGFIGPAHVSTVIGTRPYESFAQDDGKPVVVAGFEPLDVLLAIRMLIRQVNEGRSEVENEFTRAVDRDGNRKAQSLVNDIFELREEFAWRGLGTLPHSAWQLREEFAYFDAEKRFKLTYHPVYDHNSCECAAILRGIKRPEDCRLFGRICHPENPLGACMVSSEGACAAHYTYGRHTHV